MSKQSILADLRTRIEAIERETSSEKSEVGQSVHAASSAPFSQARAAEYTRPVHSLSHRSAEFAREKKTDAPNGLSHNVSSCEMNNDGPDALSRFAPSYDIYGNVSDALSHYAPSGETNADAACDHRDALKKIIALVNVSERSQKAIRERLFKDGFTRAEIESAIEKALDYGFIDDARFSAVLIRSRLAQGRGIPGITRELHSHGIEIEDVPGWPEEFITEEDEIDRALSYLRKHPTRSKNAREGAYRKLVQRGFSSSVAANAAREWASETH